LALSLLFLVALFSVSFNLDDRNNLLLTLPAYLALPLVRVPSGIFANRYCLRRSISLITEARRFHPKMDPRLIWLRGRSGPNGIALTVAPLANLAWAVWQLLPAA